MPRAIVLDKMQRFRYHLFEMGGISISGIFKGSDLNPIFGFSRISSPVMSVRVKTINPGNALFPEYVVQNSEFGQITMGRGVVSVDSDFWQWIVKAVAGENDMRKDLLLVHFTNKSPFGLSRRAESASESIGGVGGRAIQALGQSVSGFPFLPGKGYNLINCLPIEYRSGNDFDADSSEVMIQSLTVRPESIDEISLDTVAADILS